MEAAGATLIGMSTPRTDPLSLTFLVTALSSVPAASAAAPPGCPQPASGAGGGTSQVDHNRVWCRTRTVDGVWRSGVRNPQVAVSTQAASQRAARTGVPA